MSHCRVTITPDEPYGLACAVPPHTETIEVVCRTREFSIGALSIGNAPRRAQQDRTQSGSERRSSTNFPGSSRVSRPSLPARRNGCGSFFGWPSGVLLYLER